MIVYDGIQSNQAEAQVGRNFAVRVSGGRREFMIFDWPMHFDLDKLAGTDEEQEADPWGAWLREMLGELAGVKVSDSGYFRDGVGQLGLHQSLHIAHAARWISLFERALFLGIEESQARGNFEKDFGHFDARTRELWLAMAKEKRGWLSMEDGELIVDLPATGSCAIQAMRELMKASAEDEESMRFTSGLLSHLTEMRIADEHVVLRWKLEGPTFTFAAPKDHVYDASLAESLRESKSLPETMLSREEVIRSFSKR
ncbi:MAG TPA: hypothetical protein VK843_14010 [Planctomycetota bacterium]|nr:hypothetical protein [Planctomycetota bacterium]